jgi:hypothetical protein
MISHREVQGLALHSTDQTTKKQLWQDLEISKNGVTQFTAIAKKITNFVS